MRPALALLLVLAVAAAAAWPAPAAAQLPSRLGAPPPASEEPVKPHRPGELDCSNCHLGKHQGIVQMYIGIGGRGTPTIPSHMFQVRVECIACHITPKVPEDAAQITGQTFRPSEQACLGCHGEKYRGMLERWTNTLTRMTDILTPKVKTMRAAVEAADRRSPKAARARERVDDADFNVRYVVLAKGVHNVFYAADMLKLANTWLDEAAALLGKPPAPDDQLVRGGYCAVLCHQAAGVKQKDVVTFAGAKVPHVRHVSEFGATCTSCHSAETHKAVTATAATCRGCHHSPQNERCEGCHARQAVFYKGEVKTPVATLTPNLMAPVVGCTGCHDFGAKSWRAAVRDKCVGCHAPPYTALLTEWTTGYGADLKKTAEAVHAAEAAVARARRAGRTTPAADGLLKEAGDALALVRGARPVHNPLAADALLAGARRRAQDAAAEAAR
jgi:outer membrane murein-binding lipoprotein Lpp